MSTTNVRVQEAQYRTAQFLQYIVNQAVSFASIDKSYNGNPYKVKLKPKELIDGFTSEFFTTTMTTKRYFDNLLNNQQRPFDVNLVKGELTLNPEKAGCHISIGSNLVRMPIDPEKQPQQTEPQQ
jgi:hypothetical protein